MPVAIQVYATLGLHQRTDERLQSARGDLMTVRGEMWIKDQVGPFVGSLLKHRRKVEHRDRGWSVLLNHGLRGIEVSGFRIKPEGTECFFHALWVCDEGGRHDGDATFDVQFAACGSKTPERSLSVRLNLFEVVPIGEG